MPQLVVNMKVSTLNKHGGNLKNNRFKMRHAAYSNRCVQLGKSLNEHFRLIEFKI